MEEFLAYAKAHNAKVSMNGGRCLLEYAGKDNVEWQMVLYEASLLDGWELSIEGAWKASIYRA